MEKFPAGTYTSTFRCERCDESLHIVSVDMRKDKWDVLDNYYGYGRVVAAKCDRCGEMLVTVQKVEFNKEAGDYRGVGSAVIATHWKPYPRHRDFANVIYINVNGNKQGSILNMHCGKVPITLGLQDEGDCYPYKRCFIGNNLFNQVVELTDIKDIRIECEDLVERKKYEFNSLEEAFDCK
jgi:hypothetical protein